LITAVLVLGMHRSGTSAVTRMLNLCGANLGCHLLPPKPDNERGFWENETFLELHENVLAQWSLRWHDIAQFPPDWRQSPAARRFTTALRHALATEFGDSRLVLVKDPRLSLLAPLWTDALRGTPIHPAFVIVVRHPDEVAASLGKRDGLSIAHSRMLWLQHMVECVRATRAHPRVFVHYDDVLRDWRKQLGRIQSALALDLPERNARTEAEIDAFIEPSLRHHRAGPDAPETAPMPAMLGEIYRYLQTLCADGATDPAHFDKLIAHFESQMEIAGPLIRDLTDKIASDHARRAEELDKARAVIHAKDEEIEQARKVVRAKDEEIDRARATIEAGKTEIERSRQAHFARDEREASLLRELERMKLNDEELRAENLRAARVWHDTETALRAQAENALRERVDLRNELARTSQSRDGIEAAYREELQAARSNIDALADAIETARAAHRARDITERVLHDEIVALRGSLWFRIGRALRLLSAPQVFHLTVPTADFTGQEQVADTLRFAVDTPVDGKMVDETIRIAGWCFDTAGSRVAIRIRSGERAVYADMDLPRPDVAAAFADCAAAGSCGFSAAIDLPEGTHDVVVEARTAAGHAWQPLGTRRVMLRRAPLRISLDTPSSMLVECGPLRISGWCVHPHARVMDLCLVAGPTRIPCQYRLERTDVAQALPDIPGSSHSGFEVTLSLPPGKWRLEFLAVLEDGSECMLEWPQTLRVRKPPLHRRFVRAARSHASWMRLALREGSRWIAEHRRVPRPREIPQLIRLSRELHMRRIASPQIAAPAGFRLPEVRDSYAAWQDCNHFTAAARADLQRRLADAGTLPALSIVMPVYNPPLPFLRQAIDSVRAQAYPDWELCIADDASTVDGVREYLREVAATEPRVRLCLRNANGNISLATNSAAELAHGEFLVFLDQDDLLAPDALAEIALAACAQPDADVLYSDDDKIDVDGHRFAPQFKPDWSPELLLGYMYFSHVFAVRRALYEDLGGMRTGFEGSQDYDLALRASERARAIVHIPQVLYHWRVLPGSTAASGAAKPQSFEAGRRAVAQALQRRGIVAEAFQPEWAVKAQCGIFNLRFPDDGPKVSIVIPTRNEVEVLRRCLDSLRRTTYRNYEVLIIDNESDDPEVLRYFESCGHRVVRIPNPNRRFNYAHINNRAAELADGDLLLFLNNDTEVVEPRWLSQMVGHAHFTGVGAVGARLLYPDKRIQHAGIVHGYYGGLAGPAFKLLPAWDNGYLSYARVTRNYSAVTAACLLTPRKTFLEFGGFDESRFEVAYNDVDYCYRLVARGLRCVYCADAELLHHEGHSRGFFDRPQEIAAFRHRYAGMRDLFYSPHLSLDDERFAIKPRRWRPGRSPPVRALMCAFNLNLEGAPYSQLELTLELKHQGFIDPVVYAPQDGPLRKAYEEADIPVHVFSHPLAGAFTVDAYDAALAEFGDFIRSTRAEVVYGNTLQTFYAIDAAHRLGLPTIWNPRESEPWQTYFDFLPLPLAARALHCFEYPYRVVFVADATRKVWQRLESRGNFTVIHNGLNLERLRKEADRFPRAQARSSLGIEDGDVTLLLTGTVCERKGQQDLVRALALLPHEIVARLRCFIVGDRVGSYSAELHKLVQSLDDALRDRVHIVPETHDIVRYYQAADIFVCTSRVESFPRVILEAMAFALPVVSTRVFGVVEQVRDGVNALLYEPGDVNTLAAHVTQAVGDDELRMRLAANSPHVLDTLNTFDEMVAAYGEIFHEAALLVGRRSE
jgi:GT2 family glycosyltransferase/glycosyltransferase involved in cell wall biosynthesis